MAILKTKVKLYIEENSETWNDTKVLLQNDGEGDYIKEWSYSFAKPTQQQLDAKETEANQYEQNLITSKSNAKTSAITKLKELGLTDDEIKAIKEVV